MPLAPKLSRLYKLPDRPEIMNPPPDNAVQASQEASPSGSREKALLPAMTNEAKHLKPCPSAFSSANPSALKKQLTADYADDR